MEKSITSEVLGAVVEHEVDKLVVAFERANHWVDTANTVGGHGGRRENGRWEPSEEGEGDPTFSASLKLHAHSLVERDVVGKDGAACQLSFGDGFVAPVDKGPHYTVA